MVGMGRVRHYNVYWGETLEGKVCTDSPAPNWHILENRYYRRPYSKEPSTDIHFPWKRKGLPMSRTWYYFLIQYINSWINKRLYWFIVQSWWERKKKRWYDQSGCSHSTPTNSTLPPPILWKWCSLLMPRCERMVRYIVKRYEHQSIETMRLLCGDSGGWEGQGCHPKFEGWRGWQGRKGGQGCWS